MHLAEHLQRWLDMYFDLIISNNWCREQKDEISEKKTQNSKIRCQKIEFADGSSIFI